MNKADRNYSIQPHGLHYEKRFQGTGYADGEEAAKGILSRMWYLLIVRVGLNLRDKKRRGGKKKRPHAEVTADLIVLVLCVRRCRCWQAGLPRRPRGELHLRLAGARRPVLDWSPLYPLPVLLCHWSCRRHQRWIGGTSARVQEGSAGEERSPGAASLSIHRHALLTAICSL